MSVPDEVYQELFDEKVQLESDNEDLRTQIEQGLVLYSNMRDERNELRDERKLDIFRATLRRVFDQIDITDPPANLATRIGNFVNNLYDKLYQ